jgi:hypothetical protein
MTDDDALDANSRRLLGSLRELKDLEQQKRSEARSSEGFHRLAEDVSAKASEVFRLAAAEQLAGESDSPRPEEREEQSPGDWTDHAEDRRDDLTG